MLDRTLITKIFLIFMMAAVIYACYLVFKPFLTELLAAAILTTIFWTPYRFLTARFGGRRRLAALVMCILIALVVIIPLANFIAYSAQKSVSAYQNFSAFLNASGNFDGLVRGNSLLTHWRDIILGNENIKNFVLDLANRLNSWLVSGAGNLIVSTTNFIISILLTIFTMFFFFADGPEMLEKFMALTPLPDKYDREIFKKFRDISYSTMLSTLLTSIAQAAVGTIGLVIVGIPAFFFGIAMAFLSLLPYIGSGFIWFPIGVYLLIVGKYAQGIFLLLWGLLVISTIDNLIKAYIIKGKAEVHPLFIIFSILGGISLFGFWGIVFGPLIISLAVTIFHIYEMEYGKVLQD